MSKKLGQEPAFPCLEYNENGNGNAIVLTVNGERNVIPFKEGMSKRFYTACVAMQGLLANSYSDIVGLTTEQLIGVSYECADELLKQEDNE